MARAPSHRWEWTLPNGARIAAELDTSSDREVVFVGAQVVFDGARATRPSGHTLVAQPAPGSESDEPLEALVTFQPNAPICVLRVDGFEVAPTRWPLPPKSPERAPPQRPSSLLLWALIAGAVAAVGVALLVWFSASHAGEQDLSSYHRAVNGLFIAHYPPSLKVRPAIVPAPLAGILLEDEAAGETVVVTAFPIDSANAPDRWVIQQRFHDEVLANVPKNARTYVELERREDRCLGEAGAVITGRFDRPDGAPVRVWSCAVVKGARGYIVAFVFSDPSGAARLRRIVDGTELTELAPLDTSQ